MPNKTQSDSTYQRIGHISQIGRSVIYFLLFFLPFNLQASDVVIDIAQAADNFLRAHLEELVKEEKISRFEYKIGNMDPRLTLKPCSDSDYEIELLSDPLKTSRNSVQVSCPNNWRIILQTQIQVLHRALVAKASLRKGQMISESHLEFADLPANQLRYGHYQDMNNLIGLEAKRTIAVGQPITPAHVKSALLISKGEEVVISAKSDILDVRMPGTAMSSGSQGDQILVRNTTSNRVVKGFVVKKGWVEIPF